VEEDIPVHVGPSSSTTTFVHLYSEDANTRQEQVRDVASPFTVDDVVGIDADVFHLGPLNRNDIPLDVVEHLSARATVSIDVQGYLREVVSEIGGWRTLRYGPWAGIDSILASTHILKASAEEARIMSENEEDLTALAAALAARGPSEVIITRGSESSILYCEGPGGHGGHCIPSYQPETAIVDPTGCGDTFMAGYLHWRTRSSDAAKIGQFAAMTATLKLAGDGAFNGGEADVLEFARKAGRPL
jgi:sugar/nucleoside kinase (ribokinase family)